MKLLIKPEGGMAGDMFAAALISAGADFELMRKAMCTAGEKLGTAQIDTQTSSDGSTQLLIHLESKRHHLGGNEARTLLADLFDRFDIRKKYRDFGMNALDILNRAEIRAHKEFNIVIEPDCHHSHSHSHSHDHSHSHSHEHSHDHHHHHSHDHDHKHHHHDHSHHDSHHHHEHDSKNAHSHDHHHSHHHHAHEESYLHEAQDILIDIIGSVVGLQQMDIEPQAEILCPVSVGGGHVHCSHGILQVPAPATSVILEESGIPWKKGPIEKELFTPTGAAILAALGSKLNETIDIQSLKYSAIGKSRGTKIFEIPPLEIYIF